MAEVTKKAIGLEALGVAVGEIKKTYPTREQVTQQITDAALSGASITFATEEEVLALFEDKTQDGSEQGT